MDPLVRTTNFTYAPTTPRFTPAVVDKLIAAYPGLVANMRESHNGPHAHQLVFEGPVESVGHIRSDVNFFDTALTPVPLENITSRLDNFQALGPGHIKLAEATRKLLSMDVNVRAAGLFIYGPPGIGKTHFSVGLAKKAMEAGAKVLYVTPQSLDKAEKALQGLTVLPVLVMDDFHEPYGMSADFFKKIILRLHENGGRAFVTSNMSYKEFMQKLFFANETDRQRWSDRTQNTLMPVELTGNSQRAEKAWWVE